MNYSAFFFSAENRAVTHKLMRFSLWMLLLPLSAFFFMHYAIFGGDKDTMHWCGLGAVLTCNFIIAAYVYMAFNEDHPKQEISTPARRSPRATKKTAD